MAYLVGIDLGTSAVKIGIFDERGEVVATASGDYALLTPQVGYVEQDPNEWWSVTANTIRELLEKSKVDPGNIVGVGVDGQSWSAVALDRAGEVLCPTPIWMDARAADICRNMEKELGDEMFRVSKNRFAPSYSTPKVLWYQKNSTFYQKIHQILQSNSFLVQRLTGKFSQDLSQGYGLHFFDMAKGCYDQDLAKSLGISLDLFPEIVNCSTVVGTVTAAAAAFTGLRSGTPVVAGGLDAAAATLGAGVIHPGQTQEQGGQAGGMSICSDVCAGDRNLILSFHVLPDLWLLQGGSVGGGGVIRWFQKEFGVSSFPEIDKEALTTPPGADGLIFLPYMAGERSPLWDPAAKAVFFGLDYSKTRGHMARAAMEGVGFSLRHNLETAAAAGVSVDTLHAVGGAANSKFWTQLKSDITGKRIITAQSDHAAILGSAILAGIGVGVFRNFDDAVQKSVHFEREHLPNKEYSGIYDQNYQNYLLLYSQLKPLMH